MLRLLIVICIAGLAVWACSKKQESPQLDSARQSARQAWDSAKDAASHAGAAVKDTAEAVGQGAREATRDAKPAA